MAPAKTDPKSSPADRTGAGKKDPLAIVCACSLLSTRAIELAIDEGERSMSALASGCGASGGCGSCRGDVEKILRRKLSPPKRASAGPVEEPAPAQMGFTFDDDG